MPSLGPAEILVILVVALVVFGPKRLPEISRQVGGAMRELRRVQDSVREELTSALHGDDASSGRTLGEQPGTVHEVERAGDHDVDPGAHPPVTYLDDDGPSGSFS